MSNMEILGYILIGGILFIMIYPHIDRRFAHNVLGWGFPKEKIGGDTFQPNYSCKLCNDEITQDSNGDWFHYVDYKI